MWNANVLIHVCGGNAQVHCEHKKRVLLHACTMYIMWWQRNWVVENHIGTSLGVMNKLPVEFRAYGLRLYHFSIHCHYTWIG